jgi:hypothetical protein
MTELTNYVVPLLKEDSTFFESHILNFGEFGKFSVIEIFMEIKVRYF